MKLVNKILDIRLKLGFKFGKDAAEKWGIDQGQMSRFEKQKVQPNIQTIWKIAKETDIWDLREYFQEDTQE